MCTDVMEKTEFEITELSERAKQHAYEKWREHAADYEWWDWIYEDFKTEMESKGIAVDQMYFSGFWSQGDGACFEGRVKAHEFIDAHTTEENGMKAKYLLIYEASKDYWGGDIQISHTDRYYHSNSVSYALVQCTYYAPDTGIFKEMDDNAYEQACNLVLDDWEQLVKDTCRGYMDKLYKKLEDQYEFETSMESFEECSKANEWVYDEDGDII